MWKIFVPLLTVIGTCTIIMLNPSDFWIDAQPSFFGACLGGALFTFTLLLWVLIIHNQKKTEADLALTAYINREVPEYARADLVETNPDYGSNEGYLRWKRDARNSRFSYLIPKYAPSYKAL